MSVIALQIRDDYVIMAGDGVSTNPEDGSVAAYMSKLTAIPSKDCLIGITGVGGFNYVMQWFMPARVKNFDDLIDDLPYLVKHVDEHMHASDMIRFSDARTNVVVAGWSHRDNAFKGYRVVTYAKESRDAATGETSILEPWVLHEMPAGMWASVGPPQETLEEFGVYGDVKDDAELLTRMVCATRWESGKVKQDGMPYTFNAGGFVEIALLTRGQVHTWIAHRWPEDVIGLPIDPSKGERLPPYLTNDAA